MRVNGFLGPVFLLLVAIPGAACSSVGPREVASANNPGAVQPVRTSATSARDYRAPDNAFAIKIPDGWKLERDELDEAFMTVIRHDQYRANLSIMTTNGALPGITSAERKSHLLVEGSKPFFQGWIDGLKEQARVEGTGNIYATQVAGLDALRTDVTYYRDDADDPRQGCGIFLIGARTTFFISQTGSRSRFRELENIVSTIRIEP